MMASSRADILVCLCSSLWDSKEQSRFSIYHFSFFISGFNFEVQQNVESANEKC